RVQRGIRVEPRQKSHVGVVERSELSAQKYLLVGLGSHGQHWAVCPRYRGGRREFGVERTVIVQAGDVIAFKTVGKSEIASSKDFAACLQRNGPHRIVESQRGVEAGIQAARRLIE